MKELDPINPHKLGPANTIAGIFAYAAANLAAKDRRADDDAETEKTPDELAYALFASSLLKAEAESIGNAKVDCQAGLLSSAISHELLVYSAEVGKSPGEVISFLAQETSAEMSQYIFKGGLMLIDLQERISPEPQAQLIKLGICKTLLREAEVTDVMPIEIIRRLIGRD